MSPVEAGADDAVHVDRSGHVMTVRINRVRALNAINLAVSVGIGEALDEADHDDDVWAVVITGTGRAFSAGADLKDLAAGVPLGPTDERRAAWGFAGLIRHHVSVPVIAAVNGLALGGGTEIALAADLVVAAESASFGLAEVRRGILAGGGGVFRLPAQIPKKIAMEMVMTGQPITARRAYELGLVNRVVADDDVMASALDLADTVCGSAPLAVQASKRLANGILDGRVAGEADQWARTAAETGPLMASEDVQEGLTAFVEKRPPAWKAR